MSQYNNTGNRTGQSRARGTSRTNSSTTRGKSTSGRSSTGRSSTGRNSTGRNRKSSSGRRKNSSKRGGPVYDYKKIFIGGVVLIAAITMIVFLMKGISKRQIEESEPDTEMPTIEETQLEQEVTVDGVNITGLSRDNAKAEILKKYPWTLSVAYQGEVYSVNNLMAEKVDELLQEIYTGEAKETYTLDTSGLEDKINKEVGVIGERWDKAAKNGSISSYDAAADKFLFTGAANGSAIDREKLAADITAAVQAKKFDTVIAAGATVVEPEFSEAAAKEKYKTIATVTTNTTANSNRNNNIKIAANALNGAIVQPGQELSFNETVGERTAAKGYKGAAAYNNGLVVDEIGGGVCQVSSTLYNAVLKAGLKTTVRRSHTFEPSYVTPGTDATISWGGPDYKFVNNSSAAIGIRASYASQKMTISIYGIPVLEEGVTYSLESKKLKDIDKPVPTYEEDQTLQLDEEKVKSQGSLGSYWETRLIIKKDGQVISEEVDHHTTYKGHAPVILRNTSGVVLTTEATIESSSGPASEGAGDGFIDPIGSPGSERESETPGTGSITVPTNSATSAAGSATNSPAGPGESIAPTAPTTPTTAAATAGPGSTAATVAAPGGDTVATVAPKPNDDVTSINSSGPGQ